MIFNIYLSSTSPLQETKIYLPPHPLMLHNFLIVPLVKLGNMIPLIPLAVARTIFLYMMANLNNYHPPSQPWFYTSLDKPILVFFNTYYSHYNLFCKVQGELNFFFKYNVLRNLYTDLY